MKTTTNDVVQISDVKVVVKDVWKGTMVFGKSVNLRHQEPVMDDDHEASSSSTNKCFQPKWCLLGLTNTQKRRLQRLRRQEQMEQEAERLRDEQFSKYMPIIPQGKVWRVKTADHPARPIKPLQATGRTGTADWSDLPKQPVRPVEPSIQQKAKSKVPVLAPCDEETLLVSSVQDDELVDNEATPRT